jgi:hypothetical protein
LSEQAQVRHVRLNKDNADTTTTVNERTVHGLHVVALDRRSSSTTSNAAKSALEFRNQHFFNSKHIVRRRKWPLLLVSLIYYVEHGGFARRQVPVQFAAK